MLAVFAWISLGLMHDWMAWNSARWTLGRRAVSRGIHPNDIEGGFEWDGWHSPIRRPEESPPLTGLTLPFTDMYFRNVTGRYVLSFSEECETLFRGPAAIPGRRVLDSEPYYQWLTPGRKEFFLVEIPLGSQRSMPGAPPSSAPKPDNAATSPDPVRHSP